MDEINFSGGKICLAGAAPDFQMDVESLDASVQRAWRAGSHDDDGMGMACLPIPIPIMPGRPEQIPLAFSATPGISLTARPESKPAAWSLTASPLPSAERPVSAPQAKVPSKIPSTIPVPAPARIPGGAGMRPLQTADTNDDTPRKPVQAAVSDPPAPLDSAPSQSPQAASQPFHQQQTLHQAQTLYRPQGPHQSQSRPQRQADAVSSGADPTVMHTDAAASGGSSLTYRFEKWGGNHTVTVQTQARAEPPHYVLSPSDSVVGQRLSEQLALPPGPDTPHMTLSDADQRDRQRQTASQEEDEDKE